MLDFAAMLWDAVTRLSGGAALVFIVALALAIAAMLEFFLASSVVALEGFARRARGVWSGLVAWGVWTGAVALFAVAAGAPELDLAPEIAGAALLGGCAFAVALCIGLVRIAMRVVSPRTLGRASLALVGTGLLLVGLDPAAIGSTARLAALSGAIALAGAAGLRALFRWSATARRSRPTLAFAYSVWAVALMGGALGAWFLAELVIGGIHASSLSEAAVTASGAGAVCIGAFVVVVILGLVPLAGAGLVMCYGSVDWFIAGRYLLARRRQTFISIITGICVVGIAAGVWLIVTVLSVMNGFERTWRDEIIGNRAHFTVHHGFGPFEDYERVIEVVESTPDVLGASPYLDADGMARGASGEIMAIRVRGVDPDRVAGVTDLRSDLIAGSLEALNEPSGAGGESGASDSPGILIGSELASSLGAGVGDELTLISPFGGPQTPLGPAPRLKRFRVAGVFESSFFQYDEVFTYVNLAAAQDFKRSEDVVDGIEVRTTDFYRSQAAGGMVEQALGFPYFTRDWKEFFPAFFQALKSERVMMFLLLAMIMVVASFAIVSTLVMMIMEKESDIAILKTMGAPDETIERIFAIEGTLMGLVGTAIGVVAAIAVTGNIAWIQSWIEKVTGVDTLPASVYQFSTLPAELDASQVLVAVVLAMVLSLGATLLPSRQAARLDPVEALRYE